ncbi:ribose-5-phosphate isomerase [Lepeophtheirus salmonis]|uniref:ribose-5-phosphate isomerase n=1 Tax=Lepeophtheirus salmonis TaxID=72036 RepID=UPI001AE3D042|nr:ribose-5-phosphate isomerase-like [Lepeophtheirus salmonis]
MLLARKSRSLVSQGLITSSLSRKMSNLIEESKKFAAIKSVNNHVKNGYVVGIGSGSTIVYAVQRLAERVKEEGLKVSCIPTSFQARQLIMENNLPMTSFESHDCCDVTIDGCDEADSDLTLIKGGGGCLAQEKVVAQFSKDFVVIADYRKKSTKLGTSWKYVPIEVLPLAYKPVQNFIERTFGGEAQLRMAKAKAGPLVTDNGNLILDWFFDLNKNYDWESVNLKLCSSAGIVDTGLFINMAKAAYFGQKDGTVEIQTK